MHVRGRKLLYFGVCSTDSRGPLKECQVTKGAHNWSWTAKARSCRDSFPSAHALLVRLPSDGRLSWSNSGQKKRAAFMKIHVALLLLCTLIPPAPLANSAKNSTDENSPPEKSSTKTKSEFPSAANNPQACSTKSHPKPIRPEIAGVDETLEGVSSKL